MLGLFGQIAIDVAERGLHLAHHGDAIADEAEGHAKLQQQKAGAHLLHVAHGVMREHHGVWDEGVAELHGVSARAVHRKEGLAGLQRHAWARAVRKEHDTLAVRFDFADCAKEMVGAEVGDPGQDAANRVAALHALRFQAQLLDRVEGLHRVRETGAAELFARGDARQQAFA